MKFLEYIISFLIVIFFVALFLSSVEYKFVKKEKSVIANLVKSDNILNNYKFNNLLELNIDQDTLLKYYELIKQSGVDSVEINYNIYEEYIKVGDSSKTKWFNKFYIGNLK